MSSQPAPLQRFDFGTVFDGQGDIAYAPPRVKRTFTVDEMEAVKQQAFREGERSTVAAAEAKMAMALKEIAQAVGRALPTLAQVAHEHKAGCAELSLTCARKIADAALDAFPAAPAAAALQSLVREVEAAPRIVVRTGAEDVERVREALERVSADAGLPGQITVKAEPGIARAAFVFDWGDGKAAFDPEAAAARVHEALQAALAAEGLHGDPIPSLED
ncbi:MAG TPA: flagellar assembly protein FliH [Caulobacteraceae bacterium]|jgi:flagellar assembly protein FliH